MLKAVVIFFCLASGKKDKRILVFRDGIENTITSITVPDPSLLLMFRPFTSVFRNVYVGTRFHKHGRIPF